MKWRFRWLRRVYLLPQARHPHRLECPECGDPTVATSSVEYCLRCGWREAK